jgi:hypothetical protein
MSTFAHSTDEETYRGGECDRSTALAVAIEEEGIEVGRTVWTGEVINQQAGEFFGGRDTVGYMQELAYDEAGEFAEDWLADVTKEQEAELHDAIVKAINEWADKHGLHPTFYTVENTEAHVVTEADVEARS